MEIQQLLYFKQVAATGSVTKAAMELHISQPSLSSSLIRLEKELGANLFDRKGHKLVLNEFGIYFLNNANKILSLISSSRSKAIDENLLQTISIAFQTFHTSIIPVCDRFRSQHPNVSFNFYHYPLHENVQLPSFDFVVSNANMVLPLSINSIVLESRSYYAVLPDTHPLAAKKTIALSELQNELFCFLCDAKGNYETPFQLCIENGFVPHCVFSTNSIAYKLQVILDKAAIAIVAEGWKSLLKNNPFKLIPIKGLENYTNTLLSWSDDIRNTPINISFMEYVRKEFQNPEV